MTQTSGPLPKAEKHPTGEPDPLSGHITDDIESIAAFQLREEQKLGHAHRRGYFPTKVRKVAQNIGQVPMRKRFSAILQLPAWGLV